MIGSGWAKNAEKSVRWIKDVQVAAKQFETQALTDDEKGLLLYIYKKRLRLFTSAYPLIIIFAFISGLRIDFSSRHSKRITRYNIKDDGDGVVTRIGMRAIGVSFLEIPILCIGLATYRKRIAPFRKDAKNGMKELIPYEITRKELFPEVNEYYLSFDDPDYIHYCVDETTFYKYSVGDVVYVPRAPLSRFSFDKSKGFRLM